MVATKATTGVIADDAIGVSQIADDAVGLSQLSATGTASSSTFLRGDNSWAEAGGGSLNYVNSVTLDGSTEGAFTGLTTYDTYFFRYEGLVGSASANDRIVMSDDNGSSYESSGYAWSGVSYPSNGSLSNPYSRSTHSIDLSYTYAGSTYRAGWLYLHRKGKSATGAVVNFQNWGLEDASGYETGRVGGGMLDTGTIVNAIKFYRSAGNYSAGKIYVYGLSNS